jgi:hypothetical protein
MNNDAYYDDMVRQFAFDADDHRPHHARLTDDVRQLRAATRAAYLQQLSVGGGRPPARRSERLPPLSSTVYEDGLPRMAEARAHT